MKIEIKSTAALGVPGKIFSSLFSSVFMIFGLVGTVVISYAMIRGAQTRFWDKTPCRITQSEIQISSDGSGSSPYTWIVSYGYEIEGKQYQSNQITKDKSKQGFDSYTKAVKRQMEYPVGQDLGCYVNPKNPEIAILNHEPIYFGLFVLIPLIFFLVGAGSIYATWRKKNVSAVRRPWSPLGTRSFYLIFFLAGAGFLIPFSAPLYRYITSYRWIQTPCTVVTSSVRSSSDDEGGTTYRADVLYEYTFNEKVYRSNQFGFMDVSSSGRDGKIETVQEYHKGKETQCWVDPGDPMSAVLSRSFPMVSLIAGIPLLFVVIGAAGFIKGWGIKPKVPYKADSTGKWHRYEPGKPVMLSSSSARMQKAAFGLFVVLFWNGIVSVFVHGIISNWLRNPQRTFMGLFSCESVFMIPFVLIGLGMIGYEIYLIMGLLNPRTRINVNGRAAYAGTDLGIGWRISGLVSRVRKLEILFEGREIASYRRGTSNVTETRVIYRDVVLASDKVEEFAAGQARVDLSRVIMPTVNAMNNQIKWYLVVKGEIPRWPDIKDEFEIDILPAEAKEAS